MSNDFVELELTYLAARLPADLAATIPTRLKDIYVPSDESVHPQLRLRRKGNAYEITKKVPVHAEDASVHTEHTIALSEPEFSALEHASSRSVEKDRYVISLNGYTAELDVFVGELAGLVLIDFEFSDVSAMQSFVAPDICLADVTQEAFVAGGLLAGKRYADIADQLARYNYVPLEL